jgi:hypothetical protein
MRSFNMRQNRMPPRGRKDDYLPQGYLRGFIAPEREPLSRPLWCMRPRFTVDTKVKVYFCDPQSPWQRGTNENTNGLLRQYFPKKTDLSVHSQADLNKVALRLNQLPRQTLGFQTPASKLQASVASTG